MLKEEESDGVEVNRVSSGSEVCVMDQQTIAAASEAMPNIAQLNVTQKSSLHLGPRFVSVTQNVHNAEMVKTRFLGLELISVKKTLRCSIAVFICWVVVVTCALAFYLLKYTLSTPQKRLDLGIKEPWYVRREEWQAMLAYKVNFLNLPVKNAIVGHSATDYCDQLYPCVDQVLQIQKQHLARGWDDIGPNFLVSGNGLVFEGRGANVHSAMVRWWNAKSITIMFLGDYSKNKTRPEQFEHTSAVLQELVKLNVLAEDYVLYGYCQVVPQTISPGRNVVGELKFFSHWKSTNRTYCL